jgi:hypothetical protein
MLVVNKYMFVAQKKPIMSIVNNKEKIAHDGNRKATYYNGRKPRP